jgi:hypothetical protein
MVQKIVLAGLMALAWQAHAQSQSMDANYYTIQSVQVHELSKAEAEAAVAKKQNSALFAETLTPSLNNVVGSAVTSNAGSVVGDLNAVGAEVDAASMVLDKVVNLGKKVWDLIEQGKPVVNIKTDSATALPLGARNLNDLSGWQAPKYKVYSVSYRNGYGIEVVKFTYRVMFIAGGSVNGRGQYVGYAAAEPLDVDVLWGFHFNVQASVPNVYFMGNKDNPVAVMNLSIKWTVDPILGIQHQEATQNYVVTGAGIFQAAQ